MGNVAAFEEKIAPEFAEFVVSIDSVKQHPDNIRKHDLNKIAQSLESHGQRALIIVHAESGYIVKGNGTWAAAKMLGWENIAISIQSMSDEMALAFLYADNRASDKATYDKKKTLAGLKKLQEGPGLFDASGWEVEEFEDLDEELAGEKILPAQESEAAFADADKVEAKKERAALPGEKMKEVPLVLTIADHQMFVERLKILQKKFGTGGTIATIVEAVKRQAESETEAPIVGKMLDETQIKRVRRALAVEFRNLIGQQPLDRQYSGLWLVSTIEKMAPYVEPSRPEHPIAEGQVEAFIAEQIDDNAALAEDPPTVTDEEREAVAPEAAG